MKKLLLWTAGIVTALALTGCQGPNLLDRLGHPFSSGICGVILIVLNIMAIVEIMGSSRSGLNKLLWTLVIVFFPVGGLIIYYIAK